MKMNVICLMQLIEYPVVTKSYDHEFLKSNSVTSFSQNNAVENYLKYQSESFAKYFVSRGVLNMIDI